MMKRHTNTAPKVKTKLCYRRVSGFLFWKAWGLQEGWQARFAIRLKTLSRQPIFLAVSPQCPAGPHLHFIRNNLFQLRPSSPKRLSQQRRHYAPPAKRGRLALCTWRPCCKYKDAAVVSGPWVFEHPFGRVTPRSCGPIATTHMRRRLISQGAPRKMGHDQAISIALGSFPQWLVANVPSQ